MSGILELGKFRRRNSVKTNQNGFSLLSAKERNSKRVGDRLEVNILSLITVNLTRGVGGFEMFMFYLEW